MAKTPVVTEMNVIPVAGYDSMEMTLGGAHSPFFTRNIVVLKDTAGHMGIGEIHGGEYTKQCLDSYIPLVVGQEVGKYRSILGTIHRGGKKLAEDDGEGIQNFDLSKLKFVVKAEWAVECALLDLLGQYLEVPMCELLAEGKQRDRVEMLGYLFYVSDKNKTDLPYLDESSSHDPWFRYRRQEILTHEQVVEEAQILHEKYGFRNFKLKGGVMEGSYEMDTCRALKKTFPNGRINIDPNGAWSLDEAIRLCKPMETVLTYVEDPTGPEAGFSSREIMSEFKNAVSMRVATNMIATDWRQFYHAAALKAVDIVLADPHFWGMEGSLRMASLLKEWGLTWGSHSNNHFDITLATFAQIGAAAPGKPAPMDTHWIWQDGQNLLKDTPQIRDGFLEVPQKPGLGVTLDMEKVIAANKLYNTMPNHDIDFSMAMQYLIPNWKFNSKKPCLIR